MHTKFWSENLEGRDPLEDLDTDRKIMRMHLRETWWEHVNWMHLAQDRDQSQALMNMKLQVP
jgi:hypothetical protein